MSVKLPYAHRSPPREFIASRTAPAFSIKQPETISFLQCPFQKTLSKTQRFNPRTKKTPLKTRYTQKNCLHPNGSARFPLLFCLNLSDQGRFDASPLKKNPNNEPPLCQRQRCRRGDDNPRKREAVSLKCPAMSLIPRGTNISSTFALTST